jgi:hypothetical protein
MHQPLALLALAALLAGCGTTPSPVSPNYDLRFGDAVRAARLRQTLDPNAAQRPPALAGMEGQTAADAMELYHGTFRKPPPVVNVINLGTGGAAR